VELAPLYLPRPTQEKGGRVVLKYRRKIREEGSFSSTVADECKIAYVRVVRLVKVSLAA
jgi:hypothetical protein